MLLSDLMHALIFLMHVPPCSGNKHPYDILWKQYKLILFYLCIFKLKKCFIAFIFRIITLVLKVFMFFLISFLGDDSLYWFEKFLPWCFSKELKSVKVRVITDGAMCRRHTWSLCLTNLLLIESKLIILFNIRFTWLAKTAIIELKEIGRSIDNYYCYAHKWYQ